VIRTTWLVKLKSFEAERSADDDAWAMFNVRGDLICEIPMVGETVCKDDEATLGISTYMYVVCLW
jgi:hypothetical protein